VDGLVARLRRCWPADVPVGLVADRAFPAKSFFGSLRHGGADFTVRLHARHAVTLATGECRRVELLLDGADPTRMTCQPARFGAGADVAAGFLVILGRALTTVPPHQTGPASRAVQARRSARLRKQRASNLPGGTPG